MPALECSGPWPSKPCGQQQHQARSSGPTSSSAADDELVDDDLGAVDEVAELGLPQHQRLGSATE